MNRRTLIVSLVIAALAALVPVSARAQVREARGLLVASHSRLCLSPRGAPAVAPCDSGAFVTLLPVAGTRASFQIRRDKDRTCLFSNRDGRFGWYACIPSFIDQQWSWLPSDEARASGEMLRAVHSRNCLFSNADGRFGLYACTDQYTDQRWQLASRPPAPMAIARDEAQRSERSDRGELAGTWFWNDGRAGAFRDDGTFLLPDDGVGRYRRTGEIWEIAWPNGRTERLRLSRDRQSLEGVDDAERDRVMARRQPWRPALPTRPVPPPPLSPTQPLPPPAPVPPRQPTLDPPLEETPPYTTFTLPPKGKGACQSDADCTIFCPRPPGCCGWPCGCTNAILKSETAAFEKHYAQTCDRVPRCPAVGCAHREAFGAMCREGRCVPAMMGP